MQLLTQIAKPLLVALIWLAILAADYLIVQRVQGVCGGQSAPPFQAVLGATAITTALAAAPFIRFVLAGWESRFNEISNRLGSQSLCAYLIQFWEQRFRKKCPGFPAGVNDCDTNALLQNFERPARKLFRQIYNEQYGKWAFLTPVVLVIIVVAVETSIITFGFAGYRPAIDFSAFALPAFGAMCGTYMFVVGDSVMAVRRRALNISDIYWYALRLVLAVPVGMAVAKIGGDVMGAFVLGTLPIDQFRKVLARYAGANFIELEASQMTDQLIQLEGVTADISAQMAMEGITSIEQLLGADPVSLAIRTGLPFKLMLRLGSQAVVRKHLGMGATALVPIGLADAEPVALLVRKYSCRRGDQTVVDAALKADPVVANAVDFINNFALTDSAKKLNVPATPVVAASLAEAFERIAAESYTKFLLASGNRDEAFDPILSGATEITYQRVEERVRVTQTETQDA